MFTFQHEITKLMSKYCEQDKNRISPDIYTLLRIHWLDTFITLGLDYNEPFSQGFIETFKWMNHYEYEYESGLRNFLLDENIPDPVVVMRSQTTDRYKSCQFCSPCELWLSAKSAENIINNINIAPNTQQTP